MIFTIACVYVALMLIILNLEALQKLFKILMFAVFSPFILLARIFDRHH